MLGLLKEVANITMATWQLSNHSEQQSLMLPTTFQNSRYVCSFHLNICQICLENTSNNLATIPPFVQCHIPLSLLVPLPSHACTLSGSKPVNSRPFFGDIHGLSSSSQSLLGQFQSACQFEGAARCFWLNHMSSDTLSWGWESRRVGWGWWVKDEAIWSYLWELLSLKFSWLTCGRNTTYQNETLFLILFLS